MTVLADQLTLSQSGGQIIESLKTSILGESLIGFCIPKMETPQPVLPYSSGQNSLTERPQILGRALCCCCRITVSRESCRLGDVLTNKPCYAEAVLRLRLTSLLLIKSGLIFAYALLLYTFFQLLMLICCTDFHHTHSCNCTHAYLQTIQLASRLCCICYKLTSLAKLRKF